MKLCDQCDHAEWKRTANGRLHPDKTGKCRKAVEWKAPALPACSYWIGGAPTPYGQLITRGQELMEHCVYWEKWK